MRTSCSLSLTEAGRDFYESAMRLIRPCTYRPGDVM
jgi:hypothetical protein